VRLAAEHEVPFLATGGRHGYSRTLTRLRNGLAIDLSNLDEVIVDAEAQTMTTGAGVIFGDIFEPLYNAGFLIRAYDHPLTSHLTDQALQRLVFAPAPA
jgi:FAD/FMN-containing dehydrogenase